MSVNQLFDNAVRLEATPEQWEAIHSHILKARKERLFIAYRWPIAAVFLVGIIVVSLQFLKPSYQNKLGDDTFENMIAWDLSLSDEIIWNQTSEDSSLFSIWEDEFFWTE